MRAIELVSKIEESEEPWLELDRLQWDRDLANNVLVQKAVADKIKNTEDFWSILDEIKKIPELSCSGAILDAINYLMESYEEPWTLLNFLKEIPGFSDSDETRKIIVGRSNDIAKALQTEFSPGQVIRAIKDIPDLTNNERIREAIATNLRFIPRMIMTDVLQIPELLICGEILSSIAEVIVNSSQRRWAIRLVSENSDLCASIFLREAIKKSISTSEDPLDVVVELLDIPEIENDCYIEDAVLSGFNNIIEGLMNALEPWIIIEKIKCHKKVMKHTIIIDTIAKLIIESKEPWLILEVLVDEPSILTESAIILSVCGALRNTGEPEKMLMVIADCHLQNWSVSDILEMESFLESPDILDSIAVAIKNSNDFVEILKPLKEVPELLENDNVINAITDIIENADQPLVKFRELENIGNVWLTERVSEIIDKREKSELLRRNDSLSI